MAKKRRRVSPKKKERPHNQTVAYHHEAGHSVAARLLGAPAISVIVQGLQAETQANDPDWLTSISVQSHLAYCAAGQAAEHIVSGGEDWAIRFLPPGDRDLDSDHALEALGGDLPKDLAAWWRVLVLKTTELLRPRWHEVEALADLLRRGQWVMLYAGDDGPKWRTAGGLVDAYESDEERAHRLAGVELALRPGGLIRISVDAVSALKR